MMRYDEIEVAVEELARECIDHSNFVDALDARFLLGEQQTQSRQAHRTKIGQ